MDEPASIPGRPSTAYVRSYLKWEIFCWVAEHVPPKLYEAVCQELEKYIEELLNRPPIMAYDIIRRPALQQKMLQLLGGPGYVSDAKEAALERLINKINRDNVDLYVRNDVEAVALEFARDDIADLTGHHETALRHGFIVSGSGNSIWYGRSGVRLSRGSMRRAFASALAKKQQIPGH